MLGAAMTSVLRRTPPASTAPRFALGDDAILFIEGGSLRLLALDGRAATRTATVERPLGVAALGDGAFLVVSAPAALRGELLVQTWPRGEAQPGPGHTLFASIPAAGRCVVLRDAASASHVYMASSAGEGRLFRVDLAPRGDALAASLSATALGHDAVVTLARLAEGGVVAAAAGRLSTYSVSPTGGSLATRSFGGAGGIRRLATAAPGHLYAIRGDDELVMLALTEGLPTQATLGLGIEQVHDLSAGLAGPYVLGLEQPDAVPHYALYAFGADLAHRFATPIDEELGRECRVAESNGRVVVVGDAGWAAFDAETGVPLPIPEAP